MKYVILLTLLTTVFYNTQAMEKNKQPQQQKIYPFGDEPEIQTPEYQTAKKGINSLLLLKTNTSEKALECIKLKYLNPHKELHPNVHALLENHDLLVNNTITEEMYTAITEYRKTKTYFMKVANSKIIQFNNHLNNLPDGKKTRILENTKQMIYTIKKHD